MTVAGENLGKLLGSLVERYGCASARRDGSDFVVSINHEGNAVARRVSVHDLMDYRYSYRQESWAFANEIERIERAEVACG